MVIRRLDGVSEILAFRHPLAGRQLVKGSIAPNEDAAAAAVRELNEEAGIAAIAVSCLGVWNSEHEGQVWSFHLCQQVALLANAWTHHCADDGGHDFQFFWHSLDADPFSDWHPVHARALKFVRDAIGP